MELAGVDFSYSIDAKLLDKNLRDLNGLPWNIQTIPQMKLLF